MMEKRDLFVFAGQSNMMGAAVFPPKKSITVTDSYEYKHKPRRLGANRGEFVAAGYPCGEFSYADEIFSTAYSPENTDKDGASKLVNYSGSTWFCPAMCNLQDEATHAQYSFDYFSEATFIPGPSMAPMFAEEWEKRGHKCAYAHIAKGAVPAVHYFNSDMFDEYNQKIAEYNKKYGTNFAGIGEKKAMWLGASAYFDQKVKDFFADAEERFAGDDMTSKVLVWCQGENECTKPKAIYKTRLEILWKHMKELGFTHFFCVRIGNWPIRSGTSMVHEVMQAQEEFCAENESCYIITRAMSHMPCRGVDADDWFVEKPDDEYMNCRDSWFGFGNHHINEKGFSIVAERIADNAVRVLCEGKEPLLEKEIVSKLAKLAKTEK